MVWEILKKVWIQTISDICYVPIRNRLLQEGCVTPGCGMTQMLIRNNKKIGLDIGRSLLWSEENLTVMLLCFPFLLLLTVSNNNLL